MCSVGRLLARALLAAAVVVACGGQSEFAGEDGSAGESSGGSSGGGAVPAGGSSAGTISTGGVAAVSGSLGTGGTRACSECPPASYGLLVEGDGESYEMKFNGPLAFDEAQPPEPPYPACSTEPLRGTVAGCGRSITLRACAGPMNGPPCLEVLGKNVRYMDRQGLLWGGSVRSDVPSSYVPGVSAGTLTIDVSGGLHTSFILVVTYVFCTPLGVLDIPC